MFDPVWIAVIGETGRELADSKAYNGFAQNRGAP
jgi:hypothetical protein